MAFAGAALAVSRRMRTSPVALVLLIFGIACNPPAEPEPTELMNAAGKADGTVEPHYVVLGDHFRMATDRISCSELINCQVKIHIQPARSSASDVQRPDWPAVDRVADIEVMRVSDTQIWPYVYARTDAGLVIRDDSGRPMDSISVSSAKADEQFMLKLVYVPPLPQMTFEVSADWE